MQCVCGVSVYNLMEFPLLNYALLIYESPATVLLFYHLASLCEDVYINNESSSLSHSVLTIHH